MLSTHSKKAVAAVVSVLIFGNPVNATGILGFGIRIFRDVLYGEAKKRTKMMNATSSVDLLFSGSEDGFKFDLNADEIGPLIVRLIAIPIFTVHNVNSESDGHSYAKILQRTVLLQNAYTTAFEFTGHIIGRCKQSQDALSSFLLPAILVFTEWLACYQDIAAGPSSDAEDKQTGVLCSFSGISLYP